MSAGYFHEVHARFGTEFWVNNPSLPEIELALAGGAKLERKQVILSVFHALENAAR